MRLYMRLIQLALLAGLVVTAVACAGWKWEGLPH
jgi:hypothetical protein